MARKFDNPEMDVSIGIPITDIRIIEIFFDRSRAQDSIDKWGAVPIYGFEPDDQERAPAEVYITGNGRLDPKVIFEEPADPD